MTTYPFQQCLNEVRHTGNFNLKKLYILKAEARKTVTRPEGKLICTISFIKKVLIAVKSADQRFMKIEHFVSAGIRTPSAQTNLNILFSFDSMHVYCFFLFSKPLPPLYLTTFLYTLIRINCLIIYLSGCIKMSVNRL